MKRFLIIFLALLMTGCHTLNYKFDRQFDTEQAAKIINAQSLPIDTASDYTIQGIFSEKTTSYRLTLSYKSGDKSYMITLSSPTTSNLLMQAKIQDGEQIITTLAVPLNYSKSLNIINICCYALEFPLEFGDVYITKNDSTIITDSKANYYKSENDKIIKKENQNLACLYVYDDAGQLERVLITKSSYKAYLIIKNLTKGTEHEQFN